ncbi:hypothetical protein LCGC14_2365140 [marine sediment metagenome]|uniref:Uncharacterized protein n=1 Tax=marine sediment metagenome TaxID=412755 RepID=A0A0F9CSR4_9ZZZZ
MRVVVSKVKVKRIDVSSLVDLVESGKFITNQKLCKRIIKKTLNDLFSENNIYGVFIDANSENELIKQNDFIDNFSIPQAHDSGLSNSFENNYWNERNTTG